MDPASLKALGWTDFFQAQLTPAEAASPYLARVSAVHKYSFTLTDGTNAFYGVLPGQARHADPDGLDRPVVGDWVVFRSPVGGNSVIVRRLERRTVLTRRAPTDRSALRTSSDVQVIASNLDLVFIVTSLNRDLNVSRLERALVLVENGGARPVVLLSKADLSPSSDTAVEAVRRLSPGLAVHPVSVLTGEGLEAVRAWFRTGTTACLIGSSGVGKSTLINALCAEHLHTLPVRSDDDKGRHATTSRTMYPLPGGGLIIDTPGLREFGLLEGSALSETFEDVFRPDRPCRYADCTHTHEPGCEVLAAVADGRLSPERYERYAKLQKEIKFQASRDDPAKRLEVKQEQKRLGRLIKAFNKVRKR